MTENREKTDLLNRIFTTAAETWGAEEAETLRPTLEQAIEALLIVEAFPLTSPEEPAHLALILPPVQTRREPKATGA